MRRAQRMALVLLFLGAGALLTVADGYRLRGERAGALEARRQLAGTLQLTDLCLFTEARYTRHPSQADLHSAFQDHPMAFEHFPSGSLVAPPRAIDTHEELDRQTNRAD